MKIAIICQLFLSLISKPAPRTFRCEGFHRKESRGRYIVEGTWDGKKSWSDLKACIYWPRNTPSCDPKSSGFPSIGSDALGKLEFPEIGDAWTYRYNYQYPRTGKGEFRILFQKTPERNFNAFVESQNLSGTVYQELTCKFVD